MPDQVRHDEARGSIRFNPIFVTRG